MNRRRLILVGFLWLAAASAAGRPQEEDPYSVKLVEIALKYQSQGLTVGQVQRHVARLGDQVSVALLKSLDEGDLVDPRKVEEFLPIICQAFSEPKLISLDIDKRPKVTLFLLKHLELSVADAKVKQDIQQTNSCVMRNTGE
jgi:hypothetical protein